MNIEYVEESDVNELIKKIDNNYKECTKYDMYIEENNTEDEKIESTNLNFKKNKHAVTNSKGENFKNHNFDKNEMKKGIDNIKNIVFKKESVNNKNKKYENFKRENNKNVLTNFNIRKKRILESSDESDQNEYVPSVKKIVDYVKKRKNQRKK